MPETESSPSDILKRVKGIIARGRWWILLSATVVSLATVAALYQVPNSYTSEATVLVVPQEVPTRYVTSTTETNVSDALQAMTQEVLSREKLLGLIDEFGLYAKEKQRLAPEQVVDLMRSRIEIKPVGASAARRDIISFNISFIAEKPVLAQEVASKLTSFFVQANLKNREDQATGTTNFLQAQLDTAKKTLSDTEEALRDFKAKYLGELPEQEQSNLAIFNGAQSQLQNLENNLDRAQQQRAYLQSMISGYEHLAASGAGTPGAPGASGAAARLPSALQIARNNLAVLQNERAKLLDIYKPAHPLVHVMDLRIASAQATVDRLLAAEKTQEAKAQEARALEAQGKTNAATPAPPVKTDDPEVDDSAITQLRSQLVANQLDIDNIKKYEAQQKAVIAEYQDRLNLTPVREQQLTSILRDYELSKQDYADLLGKEQQSQLATSLEKQQGGQQFRLIEPPSLPTVPSSPQRLKFSLMGIGAGLFLGLVLAVVKDLVRPTFHSVKEVSLRFGAPLVIGLPVVRTRSEIRRIGWKKTLEFMCGAVLLLTIGVAEFYVAWHP